MIVVIIAIIIINAELMGLKAMGENEIAFKIYDSFNDETGCCSA